MFGAPKPRPVPWNLLANDARPVGFKMAAAPPRQRSPVAVRVPRVRVSMLIFHQGNHRRGSTSGITAGSDRQPEALRPLQIALRERLCARSQRNMLKTLRTQARSHWLLGASVASAETAFSASFVPIPMTCRGICHVSICRLNARWSKTCRGLMSLSATL